MANQEHLTRLKQGTETWNEWRKQHPHLRPDLRAADLNKVDLHGVDLSQANLNGADLTKAKLSGADLTKAKLSGADLIEADLRTAKLSGADITYAYLSEAVLHQADLSGAGLHESDLWRADLIGADLRGAGLINADLGGADLSRANLGGAYLRGANLNVTSLGEADLRQADLRKTLLHEANLWGADLRQANLSGAELSGAKLIEADLRTANLSGAELSRAYLNRVDLSGAIFREAVMGWTIFGDVDLRPVQGLETVRHRGPSTIGTITLERSDGNIPETFLRGAGLSDTFLSYARSLIGHPTQYSTCYISYASKDQKFVERLYTDLQAKGVRCWFAPEDLKKHWPRIDESILLYDKLVVVLSKHSVQSEWVERAVMAALEQEQQRRQLVLFPLTLDEAAMRTTLPWAATLRRTRQIGNFTTWKRHDNYQQALTRLLHDLKAETPSTHHNPSSA